MDAIDGIENRAIVELAVPEMDAEPAHAPLVYCALAVSVEAVVCPDNCTVAPPVMLTCPVKPAPACVNVAVTATTVRVVLLMGVKVNVPLQFPAILVGAGVTVVGDTGLPPPHPSVNRDRAMTRGRCFMAADSITARQG